MWWGLADEGRCAVDLFGIVAESMFCNAGKSSVSHVVRPHPDHASEVISYPPIGVLHLPCNVRRV